MKIAIGTRIGARMCLRVDEQTSGQVKPAAAERRGQRQPLESRHGNPGTPLLKLPRHDYFFLLGLFMDV